MTVLVPGVSDRTTVPWLLTARVIGSVEVSIGQQPVRLAETRRCRQLLARLLVAEQRPVSAQRLVLDLWPDHPPERARACLQTAVSRLRRVFRQHRLDVIHGGGDAYRINPDLGMWVDIEVFRSEVVEARRAEGLGQAFDAMCAYQRAVVVARDDLLAEEPPLDWIESERRVFAREVAAARDRLIELHLEHGRPDAAALVALAALRREPTDEQLSRLLIRSYLLLGHRHLALDEYWRLNDALMRELALTPTVETWALVRDLDPG